MATVDDFINECRSYLGTPFRHQGRIPGEGLDCAGVIVCAGKNLGMEIQDQTTYRMKPSAAVLLGSIGKYCTRINKTEMAKGDILVFSYNANPQHVAVVTDENPFVMLHAVFDMKKVVEHTMNEDWLNRIIAVYRVNNLER